MPAGQSAGEDPPPHRNHCNPTRRTQDLNQDDLFVRSALLQWAGTLKGFGFDGLRVDTVPEVKPGETESNTSHVARHTTHFIPPSFLG